MQARARILACKLADSKIPYPGTGLNREKKEARTHPYFKLRVVGIMSKQNCPSYEREQTSYMSALLYLHVRKGEDPPAFQCKRA